MDIQWQRKKHAPDNAFHENNILQYNTKLLTYAKEARSEPTEAENLMWQLLRAKNTGYKFTRQKPIDNFILDFYCARLLLGIEIDGGYHDDEIVKDYDDMRTKLLNTYEIQIVRFRNEDIHNLHEVKNRLNIIIINRQIELN